MKRIDIRDVWGGTKPEAWFESIRAWLLQWTDAPSFPQKDAETILSENEALYNQLSPMKKRRLKAIASGQLQYASSEDNEDTRIHSVGP